MVKNLPAKIAKYEVLEVLGQGGMGTVYKAYDPGFDRLVAIKVIVADYIDNTELLKRFYREAKAVGKMEHANIVTVYELGEENKNPYLVMQYLDGEPLNKLIAERRELPLLQKLGVVAKVCDALAYAHQRDIVHRDVKPANVMLLKDGQVKLLDFGIARLGNGGHNQTQTQKGQVMGTMSYIAPEILNEEIADGRTDVYSVGVMLFELLTYRLPFESSDLASLIAKKIQGGPPPPLSKYLRNYPPELDEIVSRAVAKEREERYSTAQDLAFDIERVVERLRRDMVSDYVERARACISSAELTKAKDILSEVLKIDTQHTAAKQLLYEVKQSLQQQQRSERIRELRRQAEHAIALKQFDNANKFVDQAIKLDQSDPELLSLREQIQQAKQRGQQVKKLLHLAEVAQQTGELGVFQRAVEDALQLDPDDTQARVLQASLIRLRADQEKEAHLQELLATARREIAAREFEAAQENIRKAEALDPYRNDLPALKQMALAGQEQEARKRQLQDLCSAIQRELEANKLKIARDLADKALRAFPGEPALVRMKSAADSQLEADEQKRFVEDRIAAASKLLDAGEASRALSLMQEASRQFPTDTRLRDFLQLARQAAEEKSIRQEQADVLARARGAMREKRFEDAAEVLEAAQIKYPDLRDLGDLLALARKEQQSLAKKSAATEVGEQARELVSKQSYKDALLLLEKTVVDNSDPSLQRLLQDVRARAAEFDAGLDALQIDVTNLLNAGHSVQALRKLHSEATRFSHTWLFNELLQRAEGVITEEQESRRQLTRVLDETRHYLQRGALREAEAALAECRAKAPQDAGVVALESRLVEAKAALEAGRQIQPPNAPEVRPAPEPNVSAAAATVLFNAGAAVADATPPAGSSLSPDEVNADSLRTGLDDVASSDESLATAVFKSSSEQQAVSRRSLEEPALEAPPEVLPHALPRKRSERRETKPPTQSNVRIQTVGIALLAVGLAAGLTIWLLTRSKTYLNVHTNPGADVRVVGENISGKASTDGTLLLKVPAGSHHVQVSLAEHETLTKSVTVKAGERSEVDVSLQKVNPPPPPEIKPRAPTGTLLVRSTVVGADVLIDGQPKGLTGSDNKLKIELEAGKHQIQLRKSGYQDSPEQTIEIVAKKEKQLPFPLREIEGKTYLMIESRPPGAFVRIDGKSAGNTVKGKPLSPKVAPGDHFIELNLDNYQTWTKKVTVKEGENPPIQADLIPRPVLPPNIVSFGATPSEIKAGNKALLKWETQDATEVSIEGLGLLKPSGEQEISPQGTVIYKLTARGPGGTKTAETKVSVTEAPPLPPQPVSIVFFKATPDAIQEGAEATLKWETRNASDVSIDGVGAVNASGQVKVNPTADATYKLTAKGPAGPVEESVSIKVARKIADTPLAKSDEQLVNEVFKKYQKLYEGRVADMRSIWPSQSQGTINGFKNVFDRVSAISLKEEQCSGFSTDGATAGFTCKETETYNVDGKAQPRPGRTFQFGFKKKDGQWVLDSRRALN